MKVDSDGGFWGVDGEQFKERYPCAVKRAEAILKADSATPIEQFSRIFDREPIDVANQIVHDKLMRIDIPILCFELRGEDDEWTQELCDELATLIAEHGY